MFILSLILFQQYFDEMKVVSYSLFLGMPILFFATDWQHFSSKPAVQQGNLEDLEDFQVTEQPKIYSWSAI